MIQKEFKELVFEFAKKASSMDNVIYVFLFGSVARGEADKRSDVDLCVIISGGDKKKISSLSLDLEKEYDWDIQLVISENFSKLDSYFIRNLFQEGVLLYAKRPVIKLKNLKCEPFVLFTFSMPHLTQPEKMRIKRILYGYETKKTEKGKIYKSREDGLVKKFNGFSAGRGAFLIPLDKAKIIEKIFNDRKVKFEKQELFKPLRL